MINIDYIEVDENIKRVNNDTKEKSFYQKK